MSQQQLKVGDQVYHPSSGTTGTIMREVTPDLFEVDEVYSSGPKHYHARKFIAKASDLVASNTYTNSGPQITFNEWQKKVNVPQDTWQRTHMSEIPEESKPKTQAEIWKSEGRCPQCGELGHFSHLSLVCSVHGPY